MKRFYSVMVTAILVFVAMTTSAQVKVSEQSVVGAKQVEGTLTRTGDVQRQSRTDRSSVKTQRDAQKTEFVATSSIKKAPAKAHESDTWTVLGTGKYTDDVSSIYGITPTTVDVKIEESNETPGLYRLIDPYKAIWEVQGGIFDGSTIHYMYIDATDPAAVQVEDFHTGITYNLEDGEMILLDGVPYNLAAGTLTDGVITFAERTLLCTFENDNSLIYANTNGKFKVILPGVEVKDYSIEVTAPTCAEGNVISFTVTAGEDVAAIKYDMFAGSYSFIESNYQYVGANGSILPQAGTYDFTLTGKEAGRYTLFVAALDAEGNYKSGEGTYFYVINNDKDNWTSLGTTMYGEDFISSIYTLDPTEYEVEIQENINTPGYYRLVNPYGKNFPHNQYNEHATDHNHYIYIHAENPEEVWIEESPIGVDLGAGGVSVNSLPNLKDTYKTAEYYGSIVDGKLTFPANSLIYARQQRNHGSWYYANKNDNFYVVLPYKEETIEPQDDQIDFKNGDYKMSDSNSSKEGDITEPTTFESENGLFTLTVGVASGSTPNRIWNNSGNPQLRIYGTSDVTIDAIEGYTIKNVTIAGASGNWNKANYTINGLNYSEVEAIEGNSVAAGKLVYNCDTKQVKINATGQIRIDVLTLTLQKEVPLYTETGVVGDATLNSEMPFFATPVTVDVYENKVVLKGWDGTEGSDLTIGYTKVAQNEDVFLSVTGIEQTVNGEVVSEVNDDGETPYIILYPQSGAYSMIGIDVLNETTGVKLGEDGGQVSLFGQFFPVSNIGGEDDNMGVDAAIEAAYMVTWPGQEIINAVAWNRIKAQIANVEEAITNYDAIVNSMMYASRVEGEEFKAAVDAAREWVETTTESYKAKYEAGTLTAEDGVNKGEMMELVMAVNDALNQAAKYDITRYVQAVVYYWMGNEEEIVGQKVYVESVIATLSGPGKSALEEQVALLEEAIKGLTDDWEAYTLYSPEKHQELIDRAEGIKLSITDIVEQAKEAEAVAVSINNAMVNAPSTATVYNLTGQKVSSNFKGIVVKNGKAVIVK